MSHYALCTTILTSTATKIMGYYRFLGLWYEIPANQLQVGGLKVLWVFAGYGLTHVRVKTASAFYHSTLYRLSR